MRRLEGVEATVETVDALDKRVEPLGYHGKPLERRLHVPECVAKRVRRLPTGATEFIV